MSCSMSSFSSSSSSLFVKSGNRFKVTNKVALDFRETLPVGTYSVGFDPCSNQFYLEIIDDFHVDHKIYGNSQRTADRIMRTFEDRKGSTGVLLTGEKGSGKTLLAKLIATNAAAKDIPTIVVNTNWCGDEFNMFLQRIEQPVVVLFDEFEKVYNDSDDQQKMLTLFDGVFPSKKLFLLTCNEKWRLDCNMRNRPGRIYYMLDFYGLDEAFIREYCEDNLNVKEHISKVVAISGVFRAFNFDILKAMVEEMNRYNETPAEVLEFLNARPQEEEDTKYTVTLEVDGKRAKFDDEIRHWHGNPVKENVEIYYCSTEESNYDDKKAIFTPKDLEEVTGGKFVLVNEKGYRATLTPVPEAIFNFAAIQTSSSKNKSNKDNNKVVTTKNEGVVADGEIAKEAAKEEKDVSDENKNNDGAMTPSSESSGSLVVV